MSEKRKTNGVKKNTGRGNKNKFVKVSADNIRDLRREIGKGAVLQVVLVCKRLSVLRTQPPPTPR